MVLCSSCPWVQGSSRKKEREIERERKEEYEKRVNGIENAAKEEELAFFEG